MPLVALGELGFDEFRPAAVGHLATVTGLEVAGQRLIAPDPPRLEHGGADGDVALGLADALVDRAGRMADLQPQVPQHVEDILDDLFRPRGLLVGQQEQQVDVGIRAQLGPAVAADGEDRQGVALGPDALAEHVGVGEIVDGADQLVHQERMGENRLGAGNAVLLEPATDFGVTVGQRPLEQIEHMLAALVFLDPRIGNDGVEALDESLAMDDGAGTGGAVGHETSGSVAGGGERPA